jgi:hypothetical protein
MKQENLNWIAGFVAGILMTLLIFYLITISMDVGSNDCKEANSVNAFTLEAICTKDCAKFNSTSLLTWSYNDTRWHCSCENEGQAVTLW